MVSEARSASRGTNESEMLSRLAGDEFLVFWEYVQTGMVMGKKPSYLDYQRE